MVAGTSYEQLLQERSIQPLMTWCSGIERYRELKESHPESYDFGFSQLNRLCYHLMEGGQPEDHLFLSEIDPSLDERLANHRHWA
jgi:hypothetical protein